MHAVIIANPTKVTEAELHSALATTERLTGRSVVRIINTTLEYSATAAAHDALADGADLLIACGGDGTLRETAAAIAASGSSAALGIAPRGTGNLLARNLGIDPTASLHQHLITAMTGRNRQIDACELHATQPDGRQLREWFMVMAGMGIDASMIRYTDESEKRRFGWLAYLGGIGRSLRRQSNFTARYRIDTDRTYGVRAASFMLLNCGELQGGFSLAPDAMPDDGLLDVVIARPHGTLGWFELLGQGMLRNLARIVPPLRRLLEESDAGQQLGQPHIGPRAITSGRGQAVAFALDSAPELFQLDGDLIGRVRAGTVIVHPGAVTVRVPAEQRSARLSFSIGS